MARRGFAHEAFIEFQGKPDLQGPGGAITLALCGSTAHDGPCPLAAHRTDTLPVGNQAIVRVLFVAEDEDEDEVRERIARGLRTGTGPEDRAPASRWALLSNQADEVRPEESEMLARLSVTVRR